MFLYTKSNISVQQNWDVHLIKAPNMHVEWSIDLWVEAQKRAQSLVRLPFSHLHNDKWPHLESIDNSQSFQTDLIDVEVSPILTSLPDTTKNI